MKQIKSSFLREIKVIHFKRNKINLTGYWQQTGKGNWEIPSECWVKDKVVEFMRKLRKKMWRYIHMFQSVSKGNE